MKALILISHKQIFVDVLVKLNLYTIIRIVQCQSDEGPVLRKSVAVSPLRGSRKVCTVVIRRDHKSKYYSLLYNKGRSKN
jgi:hypothetical protein